MVRVCRALEEAAIDATLILGIPFLSGVPAEEAVANVKSVRPYLLNQQPERLAMTEPVESIVWRNESNDPKLMPESPVGGCQMVDGIPLQKALPTPINKEAVEVAVRAQAFLFRRRNGLPRESHEPHGGVTQVALPDDGEILLLRNRDLNDSFARLRLAVREDVGYGDLDVDLLPGVSPMPYSA